MNGPGDTQLEALSELPGLTCLCIGGQSIDDSTAGQLAWLTDLQELIISDAQGFTDAGLCCLTQLTALTSLHISGCGLSMEVLSDASRRATNRTVHGGGQFGMRPQADPAALESLCSDDLTRTQQDVSNDDFSHVFDDDFEPLALRVESVSSGPAVLHLTNTPYLPPVWQQLRERCMNSTVCMQLMLQEHEKQMQQQQSHAAVAKIMAAGHEQQMALLQHQLASSQAQLAQAHQQINDFKAFMATAHHQQQQQLMLQQQPPLPQQMSLPMALPPLQVQLQQAPQQAMALPQLHQQPHQQHLQMPPVMPQSRKRHWLSMNY